MAKSLPSSKTINADVPEVKSFFADFVYNFFQRDEALNDSGLVAPDFITNKSTDQFDTKYIESNDFNRFVPRFIKFDWESIFEQNSYIKSKTYIRDNFSKIHQENDFSSEIFSGYQLQDNNIDNKMSFVVKLLSQEQKDVMNTDAVDANEEESYLDVSKNIKAQSSKEISSTLITDSIANINQSGIVYLDINGKPIQNQSILTELNNVKTSFKLNKKFAKQIFETIKENTFSLNEDESKDLIRQAEQDELEIMSSYNSSILSVEEFDFEIENYVDYKIVDTNGYEPKKQLLGYVIDKFEFNGNKYVEHPSIIIENPNVNTTVDYKIKYGTKYIYSIRSIYYIESQAEDTESGDIVVLSYLVSSKPSSTVIVNCIERTPPSVPSDINIRWNYKDKFPILEWNFPPNKQRDIKYWQIFRRKTISEPFELLRMYDFNDSKIILFDDSLEYVDPILIQKFESPKNIFADKSFKQGDSYIYTVCSVDARGLSSNYGIQFEIKFDRFKNKLSKKLISKSGAPKAYPNYYIQQDAFVDTIKTSGKKKLTVYFSPEYMKLNDSEDNDLGLLNLDSFEREDDNRNRYIMSLINVDLQEQKNLHFQLNDKRHSLTENNQVFQRRLTQNTTRRFKRPVKHR
jgi:hypothetical protein